MKVKEILGLMNERYPFIDAAPWDNIGLLVGSKESVVKKTYVSLELTSEILDQVEDNTLLITHHPLIFKPLSIIDFDSLHGKLIRRLIQKNVSYIALHTNYDRHYLNRSYVEKILKREVLNTDETFVYYENKLPFLIDIVNDIKDRQYLDSLRYVGEEYQKINKVAVCVGSGSSEMHKAIENGADLLLTGDITYHTAIEAKELGLSIIDISHFHSEKHFGNDLVKDLGFTKIEPINPFNIEK